MDGKYLLEKMDLVDPEYIKEAERTPRKKPLMLPQWAALAACFAIAVISGVFIVSNPDPATTPITSNGDTASVFGTGGIFLALLLASLLAAVGIIAFMIKKRQKK